MATRRKTGGRLKGTPNKGTREITELARAIVPEALRELRKLVKSATSEAAKAKAIEIVLDRAYGKPSQAIQHSGSVGTYDLTKVTDDDLERLEAILRAASVTGSGAGGEDAQAE